MPRRRLVLSLFAFLLSGAFLLPAFAEEGIQHPKGKHLRYVTNYADAMLEARVRGVPIFFSRHKDF